MPAVKQEAKSKAEEDRLAKLNDSTRGQGTRVGAADSKKAKDQTAARAAAREQQRNDYVTNAVKFLKKKGRDAHNHEIAVHVAGISPNQLYTLMSTRSDIFVRTGNGCFDLVERNKGGTKPEGDRPSAFLTEKERASITSPGMDKLMRQRLQDLAKERAAKEKERADAAKAKGKESKPTARKNPARKTPTPKKSNGTETKKSNGKVTTPIAQREQAVEEAAAK